MPDYVRAYVPGGPCFFTVALLERRRRLLTENIEALREAFGSVRARGPFRIGGDYDAHLDYIHFNPVKHGWVARVADWPHSSFHRFVRLELYPPEWAAPAATREWDLE